ncbi:excisionase family DNA binding protein [Streptomyces sp. V1I1]|nr:excisionase family DNA binding protein [Streptomyces sp. V1I1]
MWVRADYRATEQRQALGLPEPETTLVLADWRCAGHGHTPGESALAASIAEDIRVNRETARESLSELQLNDVGPVVTDEVLTVPEVMTKLKVGRSTVYDLIRTRRLPSLTIGRSRRVPVDALHAYLVSRLEEAA